MTDNSPAKVEFREKILHLQDALVGMRDAGAPDAEPMCPLTHYFTPMDEKFMCTVYGRQMFIPAGTVIVGKIHKHAHLNIILKGSIAVSTEFGQELLQAPHVFVSEPGTKRAVRSVTDVIWMTIHLTDKPGDENVDEIVDELTYPDYASMGAIDNTKLLRGKT